MRRTFYDVAALIARVAIGVIMVAHGWQKVSKGYGAVSQMFQASGIPLPGFSAGFAMIVEVVAGVLLILGLFTPLAGLLLFVVMLGAFLFVHGRHGIFVSEQGFELVATLGVGALLLAAAGGGRFSLDHLIFGRRAERRRAEEAAVPYTPPTAVRPGDTQPIDRPPSSGPEENQGTSAAHDSGSGTR
ncbi:putative oxidoreductase [Sinosporangium album]|uniref:Putative oxidoreductase n=1 Tax=Sinosporangium album TaxID=504805 RepID=A0A1G8JNF3_9ACTN|nr:DoxX family protein [Sinosporangium album]SDI32603.1 putative oxidoreductase [Sinosporangium album]